MDRLEHALKFVRKPKPDRVGFIYIIQCHDFVKVGYTDKVAIRLSALQTGCPYELKLLASFESPHMERDEQRLQDLWKRYEIRGEWFLVPFGELVAAINADSFEKVFDK